MKTILLLGFCVFSAYAYECSSDAILRLAIKHREKDIEEECTRTNSNLRCDEQDNVNKLWKEYVTAATEHKRLVDECIRNRKDLRVRREVVSMVESDFPVIRGKRQTCKTKASEEISKMINEFKDHCESKHFCLPDEDIASEQKREQFKAAMTKRMEKYNEYLLEVTACNA